MRREPNPTIVLDLSRVAVVLVLAAGSLSGCGPGSESASANPERPAAVSKDAAAQSSQHGHAEEARSEKEHGEKEVHDGHDEHGEDEALRLSEAETAAAGIEVQTLAVDKVHNRIVVPAEISPNQERMAHVAPRIAGRVVEAAAKLGQRVRAGQTLAVLDSIEVGEAQSTYLQAASRLATARADFERAEGLNQDQIISHKEFLRIRAEHEQARAAATAAEDKLRLLGIPRPFASERATSVFSVHAPFAGTVIESDAVLGELATPDRTLFTIADLSVLWVQASLFEKDLAMVKTGAPAEIAVTAYPNESFHGRVAYISDVFDKDTRTVRARIVVENKDGRLKPDMFAHASIDAGGASEALLVPEEAIVLMDGQPTLYVEEEHGFEPRAVQLGARYGGRVAIVGGVAAGDRVVTAGTYALKARALKSQLGSGHAH